MTKMKLGVDVDGTLANTVDVFLEYLKKNHQIEVDREEIVSYEMTKHVPLSKKEVHGIWKRVWEEHPKIKLEDANAPEVLKRLGDRFEIHIVTATNAREQDLKGWLSANRIPYNKIQKFKGQVHKVDSKVDVHVDDCFEISELFIKSNIRLILLEQPWNKRHHGLVKNEKLVKIAKNWKQIEGILGR
ncbi:MAG: hypothetical protein KGH65_04770 [Candidatus Micrarchaeota archaeon]|nr:hypothetical protein [Candidatus Micrarchaeota archaeon]